MNKVKGLIHREGARLNIKRALFFFALVLRVIAIVR